MKLHLNRETFLQILTTLLPLASNETLPVLQCVRLQANDRKDIVTLTSTNLDAFAVNVLDGAVSESGDLCVNAKLLAGLLKKLKGDDVDLTLDATNPDQPILSLVSEGTTLTIPVIKGAEFPPPFELTELRHVTLPTAELRAALQRSLFCMSADETRYVLMGINLTFEADKVSIAATDGRRLSHFPIDTTIDWFEGCTVPVGDDGEEKPLTQLSLTVPAAAAKLLLGLLNNPDEPDATITLAGPITDVRHLAFTVNGQHILTTKRIEGNFPNYQQVIPRREDLHRSFSFPVADLKPALERACFLLAGAKTNAVYLAIEGQKVQLKLETGTGLRLLDRFNLAGLADLDMQCNHCFDGHFLMDIVNAAEGEFLQLQLTKDDNCPGLFSDRSAWTHVLMPLRIEAEAAAKTDEAETSGANDGDAEAASEPAAATKAA